MLYIIFARVGVSTLMVVFFFFCWNYSCLEFSVGILGNIVFALVLCPIRMFVILYDDQYQLYPATCRGNESSDNNTMTDSVSSLFFYLFIKIHVLDTEKFWTSAKNVYIF